MPNRKTLQNGKLSFQELICTRSVGKNVYIIGVSQYVSNGADAGVQWGHVPYPLRGGSLPAMFPSHPSNMRFLFTQEGSLLDTFGQGPRKTQQAP